MRLGCPRLPWDAGHLVVWPSVVLALCAAMIMPGVAQAGYTFTGGGTSTGTATGDSSTETLYLRATSGLIYHSTDGATFSSDWGSGLTIAASGSNTINVAVSTGNGSGIVLGDATSPASALQATIAVVVSTVNGGDTTLIDDSANASAMTYVVDTEPGFITAAGISYNQSLSNAFTGGVTLKGSSAGCTYNIKSVLHPLISTAEPFTAIAGGGDDSFLIPGPLLTTLGSATNLQGGGGVNTLDFTGVTDPIVGTLSGGSFAGVTNLTDSGIQNVVGGDNSDTFTVIPGAQAQSVDGGLPTPPASPGDSLTVNISGTTDPALTVTQTPDGLQGQYTFGNAAPVSFQHIETLSPLLGQSIPVLPTSGLAALAVLLALTGMWLARRR